MTVSLTAEQLQDIISGAVSAAVREARKPADPTEEEAKAKVRAKQDRKEQAELVLQQLENKKANQAACSHMRKNGTTTAVHVQNGNYMICQMCQDIIRPGVAPDVDPKFALPGHYDTPMFNRLFQLYIEGQE